jgi:hypothetical protein
LASGSLLDSFNPVTITSDGLLIGKAADVRHRLEVEAMHMPGEKNAPPCRIGIGGFVLRRPTGDHA